VEEELPAVATEDPQRGAVRDYERCRGTIRGEGYVLCERFDIVVVNGRRTRFAFEQGVDDLLAVEDAAGDAELLELFGEEGNQGRAVALTVGVEKTLFESVKMVLKLRVCHAVRSNCYTNGGAKGFRRNHHGRILSSGNGTGQPLREGNARDLLEIIDKGDVAPGLEQCGYGVLLALADLEGEQAIWFEGIVSLRNETAVDVKAGFAGEERDGGLVVSDLGVEGIAVGLGDVGWVADDGVKGLGFLIESG
jgi:hypothetical protein